MYRWFRPEAKAARLRLPSSKGVYCLRLARDDAEDKPGLPDLFVSDYFPTWINRSALVAQGIEQRFPKPQVAGSNPAGRNSPPLRCLQCTSVPCAFAELSLRND